MNYDTTGKIDGFPGKPASTPNPIANWAINDQQPQSAEKKHCGEFDPFYESTDDKPGGYDCEGHLEGNPYGFRKIIVQGILGKILKEN